MQRYWPVLTVAFLNACSSSSTGGTTSTSDGGAQAASDAAVAGDAGASGSCASLPASAKLAGSGCTGVAGTFTEVTFDTVAGTYNQTCSAPVYKDQADFDANEGTSGAGGTTIKSHEDYVLTATCASGSIDYQPTGSPKTTIVFIWTKVP